MQYSLMDKMRLSFIDSDLLSTGAFKLGLTAHCLKWKACFQNTWTYTGTGTGITVFFFI